ncbi:MAG TPA: hypothetical protein VFZ17_08480 [Acidimicrobiia bacterium]|nr:hypothetical protein [Acidimicrobiia bacterium]
MQIDDRRAVWIGCGVAVGATLALTALAAALESTVNGPGSRTLAPPVLWALGGGAGLCLGAGTAAWLTRRVGPGVLAATAGLVPFLVLVILGYNDKSLRLEDQVVGTLIVVVLPGFVAAVLVAVGAAYASRLFGARQRRPAQANPAQANPAEPNPVRKSVTT